ncbi:MAG: response regulator [Planctomycetes bacterium]|nr:response regulator [Planctomycetota bacterium]
MAHAKATILVVDDSESNRSLMRAMLAAGGFEILQARDGMEAIQLTLQAYPDLILLDAMMPTLDGFQTCRALREDPRTHLLPIIMVTALERMEDKLQAFDAGADDFVPKPVNPTELMARVRSHLRIKRLTDNLESAENVLFSLARAVEAKDSYTEGHVERVSNYSTAIARALGLPEDEVDIVRKGGILHDIGKIGIRDDVLNKPGKLTNAEFSIIVQHTVIGEDICRPLRSIRQLLSIIRHHHERLDGSGYPDHLKGEEISVGARIVAVADCYDAMTTNRPYRRAMSPAEALDVLTRGLEKNWWDRSVVERLVALVNGHHLPDPPSATRVGTARIGTGAGLAAGGAGNGSSESGASMVPAAAAAAAAAAARGADKHRGNGDAAGNGLATGA